MSKSNKIIIVFLSILIIFLYSIKITQKNNITSDNNTYLTEQNSNTIYLIEGDESSTSGDGTESNPYQSIEYAIEKANNGDTIILLEDIIYRQPAANVNFIIDKAVTIDGGNYTLTFRGSNLELLADVEFKNLVLNIIPDGTSSTKIYVSGNEVTFNNVSTLISQAQYDERPILIGGATSTGTSGNHTKINILNGSSETRFKEIIAGKVTSNSPIPVTINISSEYSKVDNGINLGGSDNYKVTGAVNLTSNSKNIKKINATNSTNNTITFTDSTIYNIELTNVKNLTLKNNASITPKNLTKIDGNIDLKTGTSLWINTVGQLEINNLLGTGDLILSTDTNLIVNKNIVDSASIKINGFDSSLMNNINKIYVEVSGTINQNTTVSLYNENDYYLINKENNKYRLIENNGFDKNNVKKIEIHQKPDKISYKVGESIDIINLILKLTDNNNNTMLVDYTNLNNYNITYSPTTKLTINDTILTIKLDNLKTTLPIEVKATTTNEETKVETSDKKDEENKDSSEEGKTTETNPTENDESKEESTLETPKEEENIKVEEEIISSEDQEQIEKEELSNKEISKSEKSSKKEKANYLPIFLVIFIVIISTIIYIVKKNKSTKIS